MPTKVLQENDPEVLSTSSSTEFIIDDESYFPFSHTEVPGNAGFYSTAHDKENVSPDIKFKTKKV